jgi:glycosyltransferase involved in cell wall biosynthesis
MSHVSVIIPTWNRCNTIQAAIESALNQTYPPYEILICDDGSSDETETIVNTINDSRIKWVAGSHSGLPAVARNRGIKISQGEWIALLDSDDKWLPQKLEKQLEMAQKTNCKAISTNAFRYIPKQGIVGNLISQKKHSLRFSDIFFNNWIVNSSAMIHKSLISVTQGFPEQLELKAIEDYSLWLRVTTQTDFAYISEPLVIYLDDPKNSIRSLGKGYYYERLVVLQNLLLWISSQSDSIKNKYQWKVKNEIYKLTWIIKIQTLNKKLNFFNGL